MCLSLIRPCCPTLASGALWLVALLAGSFQSQAQPRALLIEGAQVISLDPQLGDLPRADVLLRDGRIAEVGAQLSDAEAQRIDGRGKLLLPGLVDTHTHLWLSATRGQFRNTPQTDYFLLKKHLARHYTAEDIRIGTAFGALESLAAGVTTSVEFFHNLRGPEYLQASLQALRDSGIRARLLYGAHDDLPDDRSIDLEHLARVARDWPEGRISLGLGWRGVGSGEDANVQAVGRREIEAARRLGLPVSVHSGGARNAALVASGLLGPDVQIVHATGATREQLAAFRQARASLSLTPVTEQRVGYGLTRLSDYAAVGRIGLGIDGPALAGSADLFANMRLLALTESGALRAETAVEPRRILELATLEAARSLGLQDEIGSITPGKRADLILLDLDALNLARPGATDPVALVVYSAMPANVDTVIVDGIVRKRDGRLLDLDLPRLLDEVRGSLEAILERAGGLPPAPDAY
ncbi:amidohydrolase family protein [Stutzerimonas stutzeri]|uniref:amidohydrolase family protein n=1 Tax=Stutzerimonas stutzeri TaxID=316 RepID=UPI00244B9AD7|nr:amidohydrolase family protein [Stutzerimonas stutzeri]MDH0424959.1 amidohydrolase family protein [Stutzerimonas stutzeri]